jgi:hypothetical protein
MPFVWAGLWKLHFLPRKLGKRKRGGEEQEGYGFHRIEYS